MLSASVLNARGTNLNNRPGKAGLVLRTAVPLTYRRLEQGDLDVCKQLNFRLAPQEEQQPWNVTKPRQSCFIFDCKSWKFRSDDMQSGIPAEDLQPVNQPVAYILRRNRFMFTGQPSTIATNLKKTFSSLYHLMTLLKVWREYFIRIISHGR